MPAITINAAASQIHFLPPLLGDFRSVPARNGSCDSRAGSPNKEVNPAEVAPELGIAGWGLPEGISMVLRTSGCGMGA
jgi:hypothetical protein